MDSSKDHEQYLRECVALGRASAKAMLRLDLRGPAQYQDAYRAYAGHKRFPDYFYRKWLSLRLSALRRGMVVDKSVTPKFIAHITPSICPVTHLPLEFGGSSPRSASVDRLVNSGTYAAGNIAVLSAKANMAKGQLSFPEVAAYAKAEKPPPLLSAIEWLRLASVMRGAHELVYGTADTTFLPAVSELPKGVFHATEHWLQEAMYSEVATKRRNSVYVALRIVTAMAKCPTKRFDHLWTTLESSIEDGAQSRDIWLRPEVERAYLDWSRSCKSEFSKHFPVRTLHTFSSIDFEVCFQSWRTGKRYVNRPQMQEP